MFNLLIYGNNCIIGVDIMKKVLNLILVAILCIEFTSCGKSSTKTVATTNFTKTDISKVYKQGQEAFIFDDNKNTLYSIKINSIKVVNNYKHKNDFPIAEEIIDINYTYKNIAKKAETDLQLLTSCLQVSDKTGAAAESSPMYANQKLQNIPIGTTCTIHGYYGLLAKSDKVSINFCGGNYKKNGFPSFDIPVKSATSSMIQGLYSNQMETAMVTPLFVN